MFGTAAFVLILVLAGLVARFVPERIRMWVWAIVILCAVVPWSGWVGHSHWDRVEWVPFSEIARVRDVVLNVALYVPLGLFVAIGAPAASILRSLLRAGAIGLLLSVATEATQIFSHGRFPTTGDVVTNTLGALIGAWAAGLGRRRRATRDHEAA
jgi:glycopeptide antibiotics resistance protein